MRLLSGTTAWVIAILLILVTTAAAQDDPATQCTEGIQLFFAGQAAEALPLLEAGFAAREHATFAQPDNLGSCALALGLLREGTDDLTGALEAYVVAQEIFQASHNRNSEGLALNSIGGIYRQQNRYGQALTAYEQALAASREVGGRVLERKTLVDMGLVYQNLGRFPEALVVYKQALPISREENNRTEEGLIFNNIGAVYQAQALYEEALGAFEQALSIAREIENQISEGSTLHNIGEVYRIQRRLPQALEKFQDALAIYREIENDLGQGNALNGLGAVYEIQGRYEEALKNLEQARDIWQEVGYRAGEGGVVNNIAGIFYEQGRYAEALEMYQQSLVIRREVGDRLGEGVTLNNIGETYRLQEHYPEALESYQQALDVAREVGDQTGAGSILANIGAVYQTQSQVTEALKHYQESMDILETVRATAGSEAGRSSYIARYAGLYADTIDLLYHQGRVEEAFFISERGRARSFLDSLTTRQVQLSDNAAAELLAQESELYLQRQTIQNNLAQARALNPPAPDLVADLEAQLIEVNTAYTGVQEAIQSKDTQLADLIPGRSKNIVDVPAVQAILAQQTTLVSFFVLADKTLVFLITPSDFQTIALDVGRDQLSKEIQNFRSFNTLDEAYPESVVKLHHWLIEPWQEKLTTPHLAIIPHSVLHYLPFAALTDGERYLIDDYTLTILPNAGALPFIQDKAGRPLDKPLIVGSPTVEGLPLLLSAKQEAKAIAALYNTEPLLGEAGTEQAVREQVAGAGILHLAAHGVFNAGRPLYSTLYLAPSSDSSNPQHDGRLEVHEIYGLALNKAALVVLSACETQIGDLSAGDEVVGLTRAFIFAGTPSVIASLWPVDDNSSTLLMERFYTHLQAGQGKAEALRQAQIETREEYPNPYYWSGFVLSGDPGFGPERAVSLTGAKEQEETEIGDADEVKTAIEPENAAEGQPSGNCLSLLVIISTLGSVGTVVKTRKFASSIKN